MITSKLIHSVSQLKLTPLNRLPHRQCSSAAAEYHPTPQLPGLAAPGEASTHEPQPPKRPIHTHTYVQCTHKQPLNLSFTSTSIEMLDTLLTLCICMCRESLLSQPISPHLLLLAKLPQFHIQVSEFLLWKLWQGLPVETTNIVIRTLYNYRYRCTQL